MRKHKPFLSHFILISFLAWNTQPVPMSYASLAPADPMDMYEGHYEKPVEEAPYDGLNEKDYYDEMYSQSLAPENTLSTATEDDTEIYTNYQEDMQTEEEENLPEKILNRPPMADASIKVTSIREDSGVQIFAVAAAHAKDPDGDPLTVTSVSEPLYGTLEVRKNTLIYTPNPDYNGEDSFFYTLSDPSGESVEVEAHITIEPINDAPTVKDIQEVTLEEHPISIELPMEDVDGDPVAFEVDVDRTNRHGLDDTGFYSVYETNGKWILYYSPGKDFETKDRPVTFYLKAYNPNHPESLKDPLSGGIAEFKVEVQVEPVNDPPKLKILNADKTIFNIRIDGETSESQASTHEFKARKNTFFDVEIEVVDSDSAREDLHLYATEPPKIARIDWRDNSTAVIRFQAPDEWDPENDEIEFDITVTDEYDESDTSLGRLKVLPPPIQVFGANEPLYYDETPIGRFLKTYEENPEDPTKPGNVTDFIAEAHQDANILLSNLVSNINTDTEKIIPIGKKSEKPVTVLHIHAIEKKPTEREEGGRVFLDDRKAWVIDAENEKKIIKKAFPHEGTQVEHLAEPNSLQEIREKLIAISGEVSDLVLFVTGHGSTKGTVELSQDPAFEISAEELIDLLEEPEIRNRFNDIAILTTSCNCGPEFCDAANTCSNPLEVKTDRRKISLEELGSKISVDVLANDNVPAGSTVRIVKKPKSMDAFVGEDGQIHYHSTPKLIESWMTAPSSTAQRDRLKHNGDVHRPYISLDYEVVDRFGKVSNRASVVFWVSADSDRVWLGSTGKSIIALKDFSTGKIKLFHYAENGKVKTKEEIISISTTKKILSYSSKRDPYVQTEVYIKPNGKFVEKWAADDNWLSEVKIINQATFASFQEPHDAGIRVLQYDISGNLVDEKIHKITEAKVIHRYRDKHEVVLYPNGALILYYLKDDGSRQPVEGLNRPIPTVEENYELKIRKENINVLFGKPKLTEFEEKYGIKIYAAHLMEEPKHGTVSINKHGHWTYQPKVGFTGTDSFKIYFYNKGDEEGSFIHVKIKVLPTDNEDHNEAPLEADKGSNAFHQPTPLHST